MKGRISARVCLIGGIILGAIVLVVNMRANQRHQIFEDSWVKNTFNDYDRIIATPIHGLEGYNTISNVVEIVDLEVVREACVSMKEGRTMAAYGMSHESAGDVVFFLEFVRGDSREHKFYCGWSRSPKYMSYRYVLPDGKQCGLRVTKNVERLINSIMAGDVQKRGQ